MTLSIAGCGSSKDKISKGPEGSLTDILDKIYALKDTGLRLETQDVDLTNSDILNYNTGLTDASKIKEAIVSEAMITSQAYSLVLLRVKDSKDTKEIANDMLNGINQQKWICVGGDDLKVATCGDTILLIMVQSSLSDVVTSDQIVDAFKQVCNGKLDQVLEKSNSNDGTSTGSDNGDEDQVLGRK